MNATHPFSATSHVAADLTPGTAGLTPGKMTSDRDSSRILIFVVAVTLVLLMACFAAAQVRKVVACEACDAPSAVAANASAAEPASDAPPQGTVPSATSPHSANTPSTSDPNTGLSFGQWFRRAADDQWQIYSGPFRSTSALKWDLIFAAGTGALIPADRHITDALPRDHLKLSRDISNVGSYATIGSVGAFLLTGLITDNAHAREAGILGIESVANSAAVWAVANTLTRRERPLEGDGRGRFWVNNGLKSSMPSAHATLTWAAASTIAHEYPSPLVEGLAYGAATAVSVTRVTGLRHFPADAFVGSFFGYFIGRQIFRMHCAPGLSEACHKTHGHKHDLLPSDDTSAAQADSAERKPLAVATRP